MRHPFNRTIWNKNPKSEFVGYKQFEMSFPDAAVPVSTLVTLLPSSLMMK